MTISAMGARYTWVVTNLKLQFTTKSFLVNIFFEHLKNNLKHYSNVIQISNRKIILQSFVF